jgi:uncharacterized protein YutD
MKKKKKKIKLKKKNIILLILFLLLISGGLFYVFYNPLDVTLKIKQLDVGEPFKNQFMATANNQDVTKDTRFTSNIQPKKEGIYSVTFTYKRYKRVMKIEVKDTGKPNITLIEGEVIKLPINEKYVEPGYEAIDNLDGNITDKVKVEGIVDETKVGRYTLIYTVKDSRGNKTVKNRFVEVFDKTPDQMTLREFSLEGFFKNTILKETKDGKEKYSNQFTFIGDSTALYYVMNKTISGKQLWHREKILLNNVFNTNIMINHQDSGKKLLDAYNESKPSHVLLMFGTDSAGSMEINDFISNYQRLITEMKRINPNGVIIVQSILPVSSYYDENSRNLNNNKINKLNYYLAKMCEELNISFLNTAEALKNSQGQLKDEFYRDSATESGIYLNEEANEVAMKYFRTHMKEE